MKMTLDNGVVIEGTLEEFVELGLGLASRKESKLQQIILKSRDFDYEEIQIGHNHWEVKRFITEVTYEFEIVYKNGDVVRSKMSFGKAHYDRIMKEHSDSMSNYLEELFK